MQPSISKTTQNNNPLQQTIVNFQQQYDLMKSYLMKKRFTYVYEECIKFYTKNNAMFSNHEVLLLIKIIFYTLKKKMITRCSNFNGKLTIESLYEIYSMMTNVYIGWQKTLMTQMTAEEPQFFSMLFRMKTYKKSQFLQYRAIDKLIFKPKPEFVITKKINVEYKAYNFFKQLLRMVINSLLIMIPCLEIQKIDKLVNTIKKAQQIMQKFQQHIFPVQKIQFYLLKCRIYEYVQREFGLCIKLDFKYEFPIGLFQLIYKNLQKWKQGKVLHYANLLMKVFFISAKNQLLSVKDFYILGWEVKLLLKIIRKKDTLIEQGFLRKNNDEQSRVKKIGQKTLKFSRSLSTKQKNQSTTNTENKQFLPQLKDSKTHQKNAENIRYQEKKQNGKNTPMTILRNVLMQIDRFLTQKVQISHIISCYLKDEYRNYQSADPNDELIDEIPTLINRHKNKKSNKKKVNEISKKQLQMQEQPFSSQQKQCNKIVLTNQENLKQTSKKFSNFLTQENSSINNNEANLLDDKRQKTYGRKKQNESQKGKDIIIRNIMNIKAKKGKKLTLDKKDSNRSLIGGMDTKRTGITMISSSEMSQYQSEPNSQSITSLLNSTLTSSQLPSFSPSFTQQLGLLQQSSSDQQNQLFQKFQTHRRSEISSINSKYYKATNINYLINKSKDINIKNSESDNEKQLNSLEQKTYDINFDQNSNAQGMLKGSQEIEFQQIKMLDDVIKQKVLMLLNVEMEMTGKQVFDEINNQKNKNSQYRLKKSQAITDYPTVKLLTSKLLKQVDLLNKQQILLKQKLQSRMHSNCLSKNLSQIQKNDSKNLLIDSESEVMVRDLHEVYSLKGNLLQKAHNYQNLYRNLLKMNQASSQKNNSIKKQNQINFSSKIKKSAQAIKEYNHTNSNKLSVIGEIQQEEQQHTHRNQSQKNQEINLLEYINSNKPLTELEKHFKEKSRQLKFNTKSTFANQKNEEKNGKVNKEDHKEIALREQFSNLRADVGRSRFNQMYFHPNNEYRHNNQIQKLYESQQGL